MLKSTFIDFGPLKPVKMKALASFKMSGSANPVTQYHVSEYRNLLSVF